MPTTTTGLVYPDDTGHTRLWEHLQALAESVHDALGGDGWVDYPAEIRTAGGASAAPGTSVVWARFRKVGRTVWVQGEGSTTTLVNNASVMLPTAAGTPARRVMQAGQLRCYGTGPPSDQNGCALMSADLTHVILHADTGGYRGLPAGHTLRWNLVYEVTSA